MRKNNYLWPLLILFVSCQKTEITNSTEELLKGVWKATAIKTEFYNASNDKGYEEPGQQTESRVTITDQNLTFADPGSKGTYQIGEKDGKKYLYASAPDGGPPQPFEINTLTESSMT